MARIAVSITPRVGLRGGDRLRRPDGRRPLRLPARHRGAPRRPRAADPGPDRAAARTRRGRRRGRPGLRRTRPAADRSARRPRGRTMPERRAVGFGAAPRRAATGHGRPTDPSDRGRRARPDSTTTWPPRSCPERPVRGHKGTFGKLLVIAGSLDYAGAALLVCRAAGRAGRRPRDAGRARVAPAAVRRQGRRGDDDGPARGRRRGGRPGAGPRAHPRPRARRDRRRARAAARPRHGRARPRAARRARATTPAPIVLDAEALRSLATMDRLVGRAIAGRPS